MKFFCEYCGNRIDSNVDPKCPHCGASYKKNKTFKKLEEEQKIQIQKDKENAHQTVKTITKIFGLSFLIPIIASITIFIVIVIFIINIINSQNNNEDFNINDNEHSDIQNQLDSMLDTEEEKEVTVEINEFGETNEYKVKVTKYEVVEDKFNRLEAGYEYVKFYLVVENKMDKQIYNEDVNCIVDGISQTNYYLSGYSTIPMFIGKGLTVKGEATFEVPKDAESYDIRYGDYVTIHIEK